MSARHVVLPLGLLLALFPCLASAEPLAGSDAEIRETADPILDNILEGIAGADHAAYVRDFDATMRKASGEKAFARVVKMTEAALGEYESREYLGYLERGGMTLLLWKARFSESDDDVLVKLVLNREEERTEVSGLWMQ